MSRRIAVNLIFFAVLGVILVVWAIGNVLQIDLRNPPYTLTADFENSPGLQEGFDVGYLGTPIGRIRDVRLDEGRVHVALSIEEGREIPEGSSLAVRRKSAVGEPYVDVVPPEDANGDGPFMDPGDHIPIERTTTPLSYAELFDALNDLVSAIPEDDLATVFRELAAGLDGRAGSIRQLITNSDDALETFAENSELMESFMRDMSRLVGTLADHRESMGQGIENSELITESLANANEDIVRVLTDGNSLATNTADLLAGSKPEVSCIFGSLGETVIRLGQADGIDAIRRILATGPGADNVFDNVVAHEADGSYIRAIPPLNVGGEGDDAEVYAAPTQLPDINSPVGCGPSAAEAAPAGAAAAGPTGEPEVTPTSPADDPGGDNLLVARVASSQDEVGAGGWNPWIIVGGLLGVSAVAAIRPWRWLPGRHG